jgi:hypothetical protein
VGPGQAAGRGGDPPQREVNKALAGDMRERLLSQGLLVGGGSVEDFVKFQRDDMARSQKIITDGNIRAE